MKYTLAVLALTTVDAAKYTTIWPSDYHWNEDPHGVPSPLSGLYGDRTMTTTQARWLRNANSDVEQEPKGKNM